jgi:hypothetical protein
MPIVVTEGEFKAISLARLADYENDAELPRFLPVGSSGVWNWRGTIGTTTDSSETRVPQKGADR